MNDVDFNEIANEELSNIDEMNGYEFEEYTKELLEALDFIDVVVTKKSGDQGVDVLARDNKGLKLAVQCKRYSFIVGNRAIQEVYSAKGYYKCDKALVITTADFTPSAIELASSLEVELWNRSILKEKIIYSKKYTKESILQLELDKLMKELNEFEQLRYRVGITNLERDYIESTDLKRKRLWDIQLILHGEEFRLKSELDYLIKELGYFDTRNRVGKQQFEKFYINSIAKKRERIKEIELELKYNEK